ncbi:MAG TPA: oxidoreductase [Candidatus Acidoferrales bacterium]|nr:oxidoreductase [Candidatus Acidoferrales bacterium]
MGEKVWMITGASRGFGAEISTAVLRSGDKVVATARQAAALDFLDENQNAFKVALDVTDEKQTKEAVATALAQFGRIDVLVNNAGYGLLAAVEEASAQEVESLYRTNVFGLLNVTRAVLPAMRKQHSGHIINMSSDAGHLAHAGWGLYASTKFAVEAISEALHAELAPLGIHVTAVEPGFFRTEFLGGDSLKTAATRIPDYAPTVGNLPAVAAQRNGRQPGDPRKLAQALIQIANSAEPPLRLPLGPDTLARIAEKRAIVEQEVVRWRELSESTDFDAAQKTSV